MPSIPIDQAKQMISLYTSNKALILKEGYNLNILALSETFDRGDIDEILQQPDCVSFRIYYGMSSDLNIHAILVGVNSDGNDILNVEPPVIKEEGQRCPPFCKLDAGLNNP